MNLTITGLKGHNRTLALDHLLVLGGDNGAGKTSVLLALQLLALGYVPALGKRLADVAPLLGERRATISLTLDDGRILSRIIERTEKGLTMRAHCSWLPETAKPADHAREILGLFGAEEVEVAEALDVRELLNATDSQRAARLTRLLASQQPTETLLDTLVRGTLQRLVQIPDERMPAHWQALEDMLTAPQRAAVQATWPGVQAKLLATDLPATLAYVNGEKRRVQLDRQRKQQARTELAQRLADVPEVDPQRIALLDEERGELDQEIGRLIEQRKQTTARKTARDDAEAALATAEQERDRAARDRAAWLEAKEQGIPPEPQLRAIEAELDALAAPAVPDDKAAQALEARLAPLVAEREAIVVPVVPDLDAELRAVEHARAALAAHLRSPWWKAVELAETIDTGISATVKRDKAIKAAATELLALARQQADAGTKAALEADIRTADRAFIDAEQRRDAASDAHANAVAACTELDAEIADLRGEIASLRQAPDYVAAVAAYDEQRGALIEERDTLRVVVDDRAKRENDTAAALATADAKLEEARAVVVAVGEVSDLAALAEDLTEAEARRTAVSAELGTLRTAATRRTELDTIIGELTALDAQREVLVALEGTLVLAREAAVQAAGGPLLDTLTTFLRAAGRVETPFIQDGRDLGWYAADGRPVPLVALSEAEWQLFVCGITAAVAILRGAPLRFLLVEAGGCTLETLGQMLAGIGALADRLTLAIVCTPHAEGEDRTVDGWALKVLRNAPTTAEAAA